MTTAPAPQPGSTASDEATAISTFAAKMTLVDRRAEHRRFLFTEESPRSRRRRPGEWVGGEPSLSGLRTCASADRFSSMVQTPGREGGREVYLFPLPFLNRICAFMALFAQNDLQRGRQWTRRLICEGKAAKEIKEQRYCRDLT